MESINKLPNSVMGLEVLRFESAEIEKFQGLNKGFAGFGPLSVFYFPIYNRFVLQINDWKYPLLRRIPIYGGLKNEAGLKTFTLPAKNGSYTLKINDSSNLGALSNLEAILEGSSRFSYQGQEVRKLEASPDDKLVRQVKAQAGGIKETINNLIKGTADSIASGSKMLNAQSKKLTKKLRSNKNDLKMRDFKKEAKTTFKKDFFPSSQKFSNDFMARRNNNLFSTQGKSFDEIRKANEKSVPALYFVKEDIEESILNAKDFASAQFKSDLPQEKGFVGNLKQGFQDLKQNISSRMGGQERGRTQEQTETKLPTESESMIHYQG